MGDEYTDAVVEAVQQAYAAEEDAVQERQEKACDPTWFETALTLIPYIGDLLDPSCIALEPPNDVFILQRTDAALAQIEADSGFVLDDETKAQIREDIRHIWGK